MSYTGTVRCGYCYTRGHNRRSCPELKKYTRENPDSWTAKQAKARANAGKVRTCSYCDDTGHNKRTCGKLMKDRAQTTKKNREWRKKFIALAKKIGFAPGALIEYDLSAEAEGWNREQADANIKQHGALAIVTGFHPAHLNHTLDDPHKGWNYRAFHVQARWSDGRDVFLPLPVEFASIAPRATEPGYTLPWKIAGTSDASVEKCFNTEFKNGNLNVDAMLGL